MLSYNTFKKENDLEKRKQLYNKLKLKYPDKYQIIITSINKYLIINKNKYLMNKDLTISALIYTIRKNIQLSPEDAIYIFTENSSLVNNNSLLSMIYEDYKDEDGMIYFYITKENTFGKN